MWLKTLFTLLHSDTKILLKADFIKKLNLHQFFFIKFNLNFPYYNSKVFFSNMLIKLIRKFGSDANLR